MKNKNSANWSKFRICINKTGHGFPSMAFHYSLFTYQCIILSLSTWKAGEYAKEKNITISILAVEGERTGLEKVSKCAEISGGDHQCAQSLGDISPASTHLAKLHHCYLRDYYTLSPSWVGSWWSQVSKGMFIFYDLCLNEKNKISLVLCKWNWRQIC